MEKENYGLIDAHREVNEVHIIHPTALVFSYLICRMVNKISKCPPTPLDERTFNKDG